MAKHDNERDAEIPMLAEKYFALKERKKSERARALAALDEKYRDELDEIENAVLDLAESGVTKAKIGRIMELAPATVYAWLASARERKESW